MKNYTVTVQHLYRLQLIKYQKSVKCLQGWMFLTFTLQPWLTLFTSSVSYFHFFQLKKMLYRVSFPLWKTVVFIHNNQRCEAKCSVITLTGTPSSSQPVPSQLAASLPQVTLSAPIKAARLLRDDWTSSSPPQGWAPRTKSQHVKKTWEWIKVKKIRGNY